MKTGVCEELCVIKPCVKDVRDKVGGCVRKMESCVCVCDKVVRERLCVTKLCIAQSVCDKEEEGLRRRRRRRRRMRTGYRINDTNPTQRCREQRFNLPL